MNFPKAVVTNAYSMGVQVNADEFPSSTPTSYVPRIRDIIDSFANDHGV
jgi:hypothetical protein